MIRSKNHGCLYHPPKSLCDEDQTRSRILCTSCSSLLAQRNMPRTRFASPIPQLSCSLWNFHGKYRKDTIFYSKENGTNETTYGSAHKYPFQGEVALFADQSLCLLSISFWISFFHYLTKFLFHQLHQKKSTPLNCSFKCLWHALHASSYGFPISTAGMNEFSAHSMQETTKSDGK